MPQDHLKTDSTLKNFELMTWKLNRLERLNGIQWSWVQIPLRPGFYSYFKESFSGEYHTYRVIPLYPCDYLYRVLIKINVMTDEGNSGNEIWYWRWQWSSCAKLALSANWTHGVITQSFRASERNSLVAGSYPTQTNFLWLLICIGWFRCIHVTTSTKFQLK